MEKETIAAIATAPGEGGISIVRFSGAETGKILDGLFFCQGRTEPITTLPSHTMHYGQIRYQGRVVDEVMAVFMKAPKSYTREDVGEIHCHGGMEVTREVLEAVFSLGARPAEPGEFTKRAFLNGRIDLAQAEAVMDVIQAKNQWALSSSLGKLTGAFSGRIRGLREEILRDAAFLEAALDDPEHMEAAGYGEKMKPRLLSWEETIEGLLRKSQEGKLLQEGIQTVIVGKPNVGKSSLLNALLGEERAIVTDVPGTTRDTLRETLRLGKVTLCIRDTAGIRTTKDPIEQMGVKLARESMEGADLILFVLDGGKPWEQEDGEILASLGEKKAIVVLNKSDLPLELTPQQVKTQTHLPVLMLSAKEEDGLEALGETIEEMFFQGEIQANDQIYLTSRRQTEALQEAKEFLKGVEETIENRMPEDLLGSDLMGAYEALGRILGESMEEDLINKVFEEFCMGK